MPERTLNDAERDILDVAYYLGGLNDAFRMTNLPEWIDKAAFQYHVQTAKQITEGGAYRGLVAILHMMEFANWFNAESEKRMKEFEAQQALEAAL